MSRSWVAKRRERVAAQLAAKQLLILFSGLDEDAAIDSDFAYLTDFWDNQAVLVVLPDGSAHFYTDRYQLDKVRWNGPYEETSATLQERLELTKFGTLAEARRDLMRLLPRYAQLVTNFAVCQPKQPHPWLLELLKELKLKLDISDSSQLLQPFRCIKDNEELQRLTTATKATYIALQSTYNELPRFTYEYEAAAHFNYILHRQQLDTGFASIVASGKNAGFMHYARQRGYIKDRQLMLMDVGARYRGYCADVTRTFMVNRTCSKSKRAPSLIKAVWDLVKLTQDQLAQAVRPQVSWQDLQQLADQQLAQGLKDLGVLKGSMAEIMETKSFKAFTIHRLGHFVGLDVHDVGDYRQKLQAGMTITIEPGVYLLGDSKHEAINVRLEDVMLVTSNGGRWLVPRENYAFPVNLSGN